MGAALEGVMDGLHGSWIMGAASWTAHDSGYQYACPSQPWSMACRDVHWGAGIVTTGGEGGSGERSHGVREARRAMIQETRRGAYRIRGEEAQRRV